MKLKKKKFLKTELGKGVWRTIAVWDKALEEKCKTGETADILRTLAWCQAQWEVYRVAIKQFFNVEYFFTRTDEYYGLCTEDESDWLMKVEREQVNSSTQAQPGESDTAFLTQCVTRKGIEIDGVEYWDADFVHFNLGKKVVIEVTPYFVKVYEPSVTPLHVFEK